MVKATKKDKSGWYSEHFAELVEVISEAGEDKDLLTEFLLDLWTPTEIREISKRWQVVKMLHDKVPHHKIARKLGISVATVTRGSREMSNREGGFQEFIKKYGA
ncbi:hypothetical protein A2671_02080 [Candidatus Kaiserbacteria bacterium RIFCSPHIGHO2_01_FULL_49_13]|uniref:Transcriptional regulator n=1 Tax=Candidatus Kaiserbacteria bacterium RIFCSPHIGHO2_01_FULL_49_13 TaxID=1798477 RepID=A0A1F6CED3_9BACT|nr:MAG: hypothetical protein A2671_02080 [Candidatus Kaiserbacteria bacterium RIFCSPHIGHO2_01_FULL_49_13]